MKHLHARTTFCGASILLLASSLAAQQPSPDRIVPNGLSLSEAIIDYLLGKTDEPLGLNVNLDETVNIADLVMNLGEPPQISDNFEPTQDDGWTTVIDVGENAWTLASTEHAHSPDNVMSVVPVDQFGETTDTSLITPSFTGGGALSFWHTYEFENRFDGAVIEITTNGGADWVDLGPYIIAGQYTVTMSLSPLVPIAGRQAWSGGTFGPMTYVRVDLSTFTGPVQVRFRCTGDQAVQSPGWQIDDVLVTAPTTD